jgi:hypothetical protein
VTQDREAAQVAVENIRAFYSGGIAPLPDGVSEPTEAELSAADAAEW